MSSLYILDINPLSDIWFANILSHSASYLFLLLIISLLWRRVLVWCGLTCLFFFFNCLCFWWEPVNPFPDQCQGASSLDGMFCVYVLGSSGLKYISRPMFIYSFSVWITYPLLKWGIEVLYCYCIAVHFSLQICQSLLSRLRCRRRQWQPTPVLLPGKIPWTEESGGLQSMGLWRVRQN